MAKNLAQYKFLSSSFGVLGSAARVLILHLTLLPAGPLIMVSSAILFVVSTIFKKARNGFTVKNRFQSIVELCI